MIRRDNVEYHAGAKAARDGESADACPYLAGGERAARWSLGHAESPRPIVAMMTGAEAADYAPQWGSYVTSGDPGAAMYGDFGDATTRRLAIDYIDSDCLPIAHAGTCCGEGGTPCADDVERLGELRAYLESRG